MSKITVRRVTTCISQLRLNILPSCGVSTHFELERIAWRHRCPLLVFTSMMESSKKKRVGGWFPQCVPPCINQTLIFLRNMA